MELGAESLVVERGILSFTLLSLIITSEVSGTAEAYTLKYSSDVMLSPSALIYAMTPI